MEIVLVPKVLFSMFRSLMYFQQCAAGVCTSSITVIVTQQSARRGEFISIITCAITVEYLFQDIWGSCPPLYMCHVHDKEAGGSKS